MKTQDNTKSFTISLELNKGIITLDSSDVISFYFIEDILSYSIVGKLVFTDNRGISEFGPLSGNESIGLIYGEEEDIERKFKIYSISKIEQGKGQSAGDKNIIEIYFTDTMFFTLNFLQFSKSWKNEKYSKIIKDIGENLLGIQKWDKFESSKEKLECFYMPYWTPKTTINWLIKRCSGIKSKEAGYCFYNNGNGSNLITLESLLKEKSLMKLSSQDDGLYTFGDQNLFNYNKILSWSMMGIDNSSLKLLSGGTRFGLDSDKKEFIKNEYKYKDSVNHCTILGGKSLFIDLSANTLYQNLNESDPKIIDNYYYNSWIKKYNLQQCLSFTVKGHEKRYCGGLISIFWPSTNSQENYNKNLHGKYLIKSITHSFNPHSSIHYKQKLVCIKNGYEESNLSELVSASKTNLI